jgi:cell division protein FtsI/penicillin-binding protein 2
MVTKVEQLSTTPQGRLTIVYAILLILLGAVAVKLFQRQIIQHSYYVAQALSQHVSSETVPAPRGQILVYDSQLKENYPLATNVSLFDLIAIPKQIKYPELTASELKPFLPDWADADLLTTLSSGKVYLPPLKREVSEDEAKAIKALKLPGIYLTPDEYRYYPEGALAADVLGFVNRDRIGQYGVEGFFEKELHGIDGFLSAEIGTLGQTITLGKRSGLDPQPGDNIVLTLDRALQYYTDKTLKDAVEKHGAKQGSVVIMDPKTGAILAMSSYPNFDPNQYNQTPLERFTNLNTSVVYEPGSVFKVITLSAAIDAGLISPSTTYVDTGSVQVQDRTIKNAEGKVWGEVSMNKVLEQSINSGAIFAVQKLGKQLFYKYLKDFGFLDKTGVEISGEVAGNVKTPQSWSDVDLATMSFGQGIAITPMQLLAAVGAIANSGKLMQPHLVKEIDYPNGPVLIQPKMVRQVISPQTAQTMSAMMVNQVENGNGKRAAVAGYYIAGKTGTAQVPVAGGYSSARTIGTFVGFGPTENPQFVMLARIDEPKDVQFAESSAAPLFGQIAKFFLDYEQIPPSRK